MKLQCLNNIIEGSYTLFPKMKSGIRRAGLAALVGAIIGVGFYGCKEEEPQNEDASPRVYLEEKLQSKIVFTSNRDGNREIYVMNSDGSEQKNLTNNSSNDGNPVWSPDGKKIAFTSGRDGNDIYVMNTYVMNIDGSGQKRLTNHPYLDTLLSWSPDRERITFVPMQVPGKADKDRHYEIYVMNADGRKLKRLTNNYDVDYAPFWSPDGKKISFISDRDGNLEIYIMNPDGRRQKRLTNNSSRDNDSKWSPDGKKIAFYSDRDGNQEIYVMNPDGSEQKRLTNNPIHDFGPKWSPDGERIAFVSMHGPDTTGKDRNYEIHVMNADGSGQKRLTNIAGIDFLPCWSPDGKRIAFQSHRDGNSEIYVMNADGTEQKNITNNPGHDCDPSWSPFLPSGTNEKQHQETR